jgi:uncharacterized protein YdhG (YjbR/CyaY superfamily)
MNDMRKPAKSTTARQDVRGFTDEERRDDGARSRDEGGRAPQPGRGHGGGEIEVFAKVAEMPEPDRVLGERLHAVINASAPAHSRRLWYGMSAYAKDGKVVCFCQSAQKFNARYATFGFSTKANLDEGAMWPTAFALTKSTAADEKGSARW